jgi:hypothetical protein
MMFRSSIVLIVSLFLQAPLAIAAEGRVFYETRCAVTPESSQGQETGPIATLLVGKLIGALAGATIDTVAARLSEEKQVTVVAHERKTNWYVKEDDKFRVAPKLGCLIFVVGEDLLPRNETIQKSDYEMNWQSHTRSGADFEKLKRASADLAKLGIVKPPMFYVELGTTVLRGGSSFALDPKFIYYPEFLGDNVWLGPNERDLLIQIEFSEPGSTNPFAEVKLLFNSLQPAKLTTKLIDGKRMPWAKSPSTGSGESEESLIPFNIKALFTETAKPGKLGTILDGVLIDQRASLVAAAETKARLAVSESERLATRNSSSEAANTALSNYLAAYDANEIAKKTLENAKIGGELVAISKAELTAKLTQIKLSNTTALAKSAFASADIAFVPIPEK